MAKVPNTTRAAGRQTPKRRMAAGRTKKNSALKLPAAKSAQQTKRSSALSRKLKKLPVVLSSKSLRTNISPLVDDILKNSTSFDIRSRGKLVGTLGPIGSLPKGQTSSQHIPISEISNGKRTAMGVAVHGAYTITRDGDEVAVIYPPGPTQLQRYEALFDQIEQIEALKGAISHLAELRARVEKFIRNYIDLARQTGNHTAADQFEAAYKAIDRNDQIAR